MNIPVHTFYIDKQAKLNFEQIASITKGTSQFLDVNNHYEGEKMLI